MKTKDEEKTREQLIDELAELRIEVAELQVFKSEQNRVPAALGESESHADSRFEVPPRGVEVLKESEEFDDLLKKLLK